MRLEPVAPCAARWRDGTTSTPLRRRRRTSRHSSRRNTSRASRSRERSAVSSKRSAGRRASGPRSWPASRQPSAWTVTHRVSLSSSHGWTCPPASHRSCCRDASPRGSRLPMSRRSSQLGPRWRGSSSGTSRRSAGFARLSDVLSTSLPAMASSNRGSASARAALPGSLRSCSHKRTWRTPPQPLLSRVGWRERSGRSTTSWRSAHRVPPFWSQMAPDGFMANSTRRRRRVAR